MLQVAPAHPGEVVNSASSIVSSGDIGSLWKSRLVLVEEMASLPAAPAMESKSKGQHRELWGIERPFNQA